MNAIFSFNKLINYETNMIFLFYFNFGILTSLPFIQYSPIEDGFANAIGLGAAGFPGQRWSYFFVILWDQCPKVYATVHQLIVWSMGLYMSLSCWFYDQITTNWTWERINVGLGTGQENLMCRAASKMNTYHWVSYTGT